MATWKPGNMWIQERIGPVLPFLTHSTVPLYHNCLSYDCFSTRKGSFKEKWKHMNIWNTPGEWCYVARSACRSERCQIILWYHVIFRQDPNLADHTALWAAWHDNRSEAEKQQRWEPLSVDLLQTSTETNTPSVWSSLQANKITLQSISDTNPLS